MPPATEAGTNVEASSMLLRPEILLLPTIPEPLHTINPRNVLGSGWWNKERKRCYESTNHSCIACGVHKSKALYRKHVEAHEVYDTNYEAGELTYIETVPLCNACHSFVHLGRLKWLLDTQQISFARYTAVIKRGNAQLALIGKTLKDKPMGNEDLVDWFEWRLVVFGMRFDCDGRHVNKSITGDRKDVLQSRYGNNRRRSVSR